MTSDIPGLPLEFVIDWGKQGIMENIIRELGNTVYNSELKYEVHV